MRYRRSDAVGATIMLPEWGRNFLQACAELAGCTLDIGANDAAIDPLKEGFDCALQTVPPRSAELVSRKLFPVRRGVRAP